VFDQQLIFGGLLNSPRNTLAVLRSQDRRPQDRQIERALKQGQALSFLSGRLFT
jgi:hypothetical protein